jgi:8-oxo-dGTP pyrophosphatase MutT (NUDIX family)
MILDLLSAYQPSPEELETKKRMIEFIQTHPDCFERSCEIGHVTGSAWLLSRDGQSVLLSHHVKYNEWTHLGGHCDGDTDVFRTALREAREESGIQGIEPVFPGIFDIEIHTVPQFGNVKAHVHYDVTFLLRVTSDEDFIVSPESKALAWFGKDLAKFPSKRPSFLRLFNKWIVWSASQSRRPVVPTG